MAVQRGSTEPRLWTRPLRELTEETSRGFEVIDFASQVLGVDLYPWQRWLLIHGLELLDDGRYRFRRVIVLVARQNGKSMLATVLAAWWLFVESRRHPDKVPPFSFKVLGTAQNIDIARGPWETVKTWCDPAPESEDAAAAAIPMLQQATTKVLDSNGKEQILAANGAHYQVRATVSSRGKPAARVIMDELREHRDWRAWNAVVHTSRNMWSPQMWGISNAGDASAVVLRDQRKRCIELIEQWDAYVTSGIQSAQEYANDPSHDVTLGLFEWSAPDDCALDDVEAILAANPSIGYGNLTVQDCLSEAQASGTNEAGYRTEVLCQWVTARAESYIDISQWRARYMPSDQVENLVPSDARVVWGVDTSRDRGMTYVAQAVELSDGRPFVMVRSQRAGMLWLVDYLTELAQRSGCWEVAIQAKGCPAMEFIDPLTDAGFTVHTVDGSHIGLATGRMKDRVRDEALVTVDQPVVRLAVEGGLTSRYAENDAWSREKSVTDIAPLVAETVALWGLEMCQPDPDEPIGDSPSVAVVDSDEPEADPHTNLATVAF